MTMTMGKGNPLTITSLRFGGEHITISEEAENALYTLLEKERRCYWCHELFTPDNPMVLEQTCLDDFHKKHPEYSYIGVKASTQIWRADRRVYLFCNSRDGYIYETTPSASQPYQDKWETLAHFGFPMVRTRKKVSFYNGESYETDEPIYSSEMTFFGDLIHDNALVIHVDVTQYEKSSSLFLSHRYGEVEEFTKRSALYQKARKVVMTTYKPIAGLDESHEVYCQMGRMAKKEPAH